MLGPNVGAALEPLLAVHRTPDWDGGNSSFSRPPAGVWPARGSRSGGTACSGASRAALRLRQLLGAPCCNSEEPGPPNVHTGTGSCHRMPPATGGGGGSGSSGSSGYCDLWVLGGVLLCGLCCRWRCHN